MTAMFLGRRGTALLLLGLIWAIFGWSMLDQPRPPTPGATFLWHEHIPNHIRSTVWLVTGLVAAAFSLVRRPGRDRFGFSALVVMPLVRFASFVTSWVAWEVTGGRLGYEFGYSSALIWLAVIALVVLIAGWPEPVKIPHPDPDTWGRL